MDRRKVIKRVNIVIPPPNGKMNDINARKNKVVAFFAYKTEQYTSFKLGMLLATYSKTLYLSGF